MKADTKILKDASFYGLFYGAAGAISAYVGMNRMLKVNKPVSVLFGAGAFFFWSAIGYSNVLMSGVPKIMKDPRTDTMMGDLLCSGVKELRPCIEDDECKKFVKELSKVYAICREREESRKNMGLRTLLEIMKQEGGGGWGGNNMNGDNNGFGNTGEGKFKNIFDEGFELIDFEEDSTSFGQDGNGVDDSKNDVWASKGGS